MHGSLFHDARILFLRNRRSALLVAATLVAALVLTCAIDVRAASPVAISIDFVGSATSIAAVESAGVVAKPTGTV
jgi:hypothetical protein